MKKLRVFSIMLLMVSTAAFVIFQVYIHIVQDNTPPVVTCETTEFTVPVDAEEEVLFEGVTAKDSRSGDVTDTLVIEKMSAFTEDGTRILTYAAVDESKNVGRCERTVTYEGYETPKYEMSAPLCFTVGQTVDISSVISAYSTLDGDLSSNIKYTLESTINTMEAGSYPIEFRVMDSGGKNVYLQAEIEMLEREASNIEVTLSDYLVYVKKGSKFNAEKYYKGATYDDANLKIQSKVNTKKEGTYYVDYIVTSGTLKGKSRLIVVVQ